MDADSPEGERGMFLRALTIVESGWAFKQILAGTGGAVEPSDGDVPFRGRRAGVRALRRRC